MVLNEIKHQTALVLMLLKGGIHTHTQKKNPYILGVGVGLAVKMPVRLSIA